MRPDPMRQERTRNNLRKLVVSRGPDVGRDVGRLTFRGDRAAEGLLASYEAGGVTVGVAQDLTVRSGNSGDTLFMLDVSDLDGDDLLE